MTVTRGKRGLPHVAEAFEGGTHTMSLQVEKLEKNMAKLTIEVSAEDLEKAIEKVYQKQKKQISIPGFRKGKVPRMMVEKMYGKEVFYDAFFAAEGKA